MRIDDVDVIRNTNTEGTIAVDDVGNFNGRSVVCHSGYRCGPSGGGSPQAVEADIGIGLVGIIWVALMFVVSMVGVNSCEKEDKRKEDDKK